MKFRKLNGMIGAGIVLAASSSLLRGTPGQAQEANPPIPASSTSVAFPFRDGDRVQWIGSSSTHFGIWPKTMQFLLRTRQPQLHLEYGLSSTGGGTFTTGLEHGDAWMNEFKPTLVFINYGTNDAADAEKGLPHFHDNLTLFVDKVQARGARFVMMTPQAADVRKTHGDEAAHRQLYAEDMLRFVPRKGWPIVDVFHPLVALQAGGQAADSKYTINSDNIHMTPPAYVAWGYYLYDAINAPPAVSSATLNADGTVQKSENCTISEVKADTAGLTFTRADKVLPIIPPVPENQPLPPRQFVPLEKQSRYLLQITGLPAGTYQISCEDQPIGVVDAAALAQGVNLNSLLLDSGNKAPWASLAQDIWDSKSLDKIGKTLWHFKVVRQ